ncbi:MAG TPA: MdtA/MuxA family multidrug efflux RND transporter periplasmic adaptor subunit, partial [Planctomycetota bacterium]|nr:MdtA/MuxA family multidrug efflux RND transporter periplasmic adaptor subunit [Planctomycetota bacterium]
PYLMVAPAAPAGGSRRGGDPSRIAMVVAVPAKVGDVPVYLDGLGTVTPLQTVTVRSRVDGQLMNVLFREGQMVKQQELLAEIDPRPFTVQLTQAEGQLARDQALLDNAKIDLARYRTLLAQDSIAPQQLDAQQSLVHQLEGTTKVDQGLIDNARLQIDYAHVTAPISGRVGLRQIDPGNIVRASDPTGLVVITQLQPITVVFSIPQDDLPAVMARLQAGERLPVEAFDRQQKQQLATGELLSVDNQIDAVGTIRLKAQFANADDKLFPYQFVNVKMLVDTRHGATVVPEAALQLGAQGSYVYVVDQEQKVALRTVQLGPRAAGQVAITKGLAPGEQVVVDGTDRLREGTVVQTAPPGEADKAATKPDTGEPAPTGPTKGKGGRRQQGSK